MPDTHAILSASSSNRWTHCTPSALINAQLPDKDTAFSKEGTCAHSLCEHLVKMALGFPTRDPTEDLDYYDAEMQECAESYRDFVLDSLVEDGPDAKAYIEQHLDYSRWVKDGFGTGDCVILSDKYLHIIDFKYGRGIEVPASGEDGYGNTQLMCYALGALDTFEVLYSFDTIKLSIFQPRLGHYDTFTMSKEKLLEWAENVLRPKAELACQGAGEFEAGSWCRFCKISGTCRTRADVQLAIARAEFREASVMSPFELSELLPKLYEMSTWISDVKEAALQEALNGTEIPNYKIVEGRSVRTYRDKVEAAEAVKKAGYDPYDKTILGLTKMKKLLGQEKFDEIIAPLLIKPAGKPTLVPESDKRPAWSSAAQDFKGTDFSNTDND